MEKNKKLIIIISSSVHLNHLEGAGSNWFIQMGGELSCSHVKNWHQKSHFWAWKYAAFKKCVVNVNDDECRGCLKCSEGYRFSFLFFFWFNLHSVNLRIFEDRQNEKNKEDCLGRYFGPSEPHWRVYTGRIPWKCVEVVFCTVIVGYYT